MGVIYTGIFTSLNTNVLDKVQLMVIVTLL